MATIEAAIMAAHAIGRIGIGPLIVSGAVTHTRDRITAGAITTIIAPAIIAAPIGTADVNHGARDEERP
jgi:hypothetical protein